MAIAPITSIQDARLLGIPAACMAAFPEPPDVPGAEQVQPLLRQRNTAEDDQIEAIDAEIIRACLALPIPCWSDAWDGSDYSGRPVHEWLRGLMHYADLSGSQVGQLVGVDSRTVRRWTAAQYQLPYAVWYTLLAKTRAIK